jgi:hypothetical protein
MEIRTSKYGSKITKMSFQETGIVSPILMTQLNPIIKKGFSVEDAKSISELMKTWSMSMEEAIEQYNENINWANS